MTIPDFKPSVALRTIKKHGLEGKITPEKLAEVAEQTGHDVKNKGYISGDEFDAAARAFKAQQDGPSAGTSTPTGQTFSPLGARTAIIAPKADLNDPAIAFIKERTLANVGPDKRFGALDEGHGLRAFTLTDAMLSAIDDQGTKQKLQELGDGQLFGVLTTADSPELLIGKVVAGEAKVGKAYNLNYASAAKIFGQPDVFKAVAEAFGKAPQIALGGEDKSWSLASGDWATGAHFAGLQAKKGARKKAAADAMAGPTTLDGFSGVATHPHTAAEKKALLNTVKQHAGKDGFPDPDHGYYGMHTYLLEDGPAAAHALKFVDATNSGPTTFDPAKHSVIVAITSDSEAQVSTLVIDRATQDVVFHDLSYATNYDSGPVEAFFPGSEAQQMYDAFVIGSLATRGELLEVVDGSRPADGMDFSDWLADAS